MVKNEEKKVEVVAVMCRFTRDELEKMKSDTGAVADATAVTCFVRKRLTVEG